MADRAFADLLVVVHFTFIVFVVLGGLLALRWRWVALAHIPAAIWGAFIEFSGGLCPLTPLENDLRRRSGSAGYPGGFVEHYLLPIVYPATLTDDVQLALGLFVVMVNAVVYAMVARRWRARRRVPQ